MNKELVVGFTGQIDACFVGETKRLIVIPKFLLADQLADLDEAGVTGVPQTFLIGLGAVTGGVMTVDGIVIQLERARAVKATVLVDNALLERHREGDHLPNRTGIVGVGDRLVTPVPCQRRAVRLRLRLLDELILLRFAELIGVDALFDIIVLDQIIGVDRVDLLLLVVADGIRFVQIKAVDGSHREDLAVVDVHHDANTALVDVMIDNALLHVLFDDALDGLVDGEHDGAAVDRADVLVIVKGHFRLDAVLRRYDPAGRAGQIIVVLILNARQTLILGTGEADDR